MKSSDFIGQRAITILRDAQRSVDRRNGSLVTVAPRADSARDADGLECARLAQIQAVGIDEAARMRHLDPQPDGKAPDRGVIGARMLGHIARQQQIAHPVGRLGQLAQEAARLLKGLMHVPQRTGATEARELQAGRGMALGDGAGLIDAHEKERHPLGAGTLQRGQSMRHLLQRGAEQMGQPLQVVRSDWAAARKAR